MPLIRKQVIMEETRIIKAIIEINEADPKEFFLQEVIEVIDISDEKILKEIVEVTDEH